MFFLSDVILLYFFELSFKIFMLLLLDTLLQVKLIDYSFTEEVSSFCNSSLAELKQYQSSLWSWRAIF
jgi:hypothetical protein